MDTLPVHQESTLAAAFGPVVVIAGLDAHFTYLMRYYATKSGRRAVVAPLDDDLSAVARRERPAAILLESDLTERMSWDALQELKSDRGTRDIPVVICSWRDVGASSLVEDAARYLQKPVLYEDFLAALDEVEAVLD